MIPFLANAAWLLPGFLLGLVHFRSLRWNTSLYLADSASRAIALHAVRMAATGGCFLAIAAWQGAWPLLATAAGFLLARLLLVRAADSGLAAPVDSGN